MSHYQYGGQTDWQNKYTNKSLYLSTFPEHLPLAEPRNLFWLVKFHRNNVSLLQHGTEKPRAPPPCCRGQGSRVSWLRQPPEWLCGAKPTARPREAFHGHPKWPVFLCKAAETLKSSVTPTWHRLFWPRRAPNLTDPSFSEPVQSRVISRLHGDSRLLDGLFAVSSSCSCLFSCLCCRKSRFNLDI